MTQTAATEAPDTTNLCHTEDIEMRNIFHQSIFPTLAEFGDALPHICDASLCFKWKGLQVWRQGHWCHVLICFDHS